MNNLELLVASRKSCMRIAELGVTPTAFFWHTVEDDDTKPNDPEGNPVLKHDVCMLYNPNFKLGIYGTIPAWTKAELEVMMGPTYEKPDLFTEDQIGPKTVAEPFRYPVYYAEKMKIFNNGAEACADALIYLLEKEHIKVSDVNERYKAVFNPS